MKVTRKSIFPRYWEISVRSHTHKHTPRLLIMSCIQFRTFSMALLQSTWCGLQLIDSCNSVMAWTFEWFLFDTTFGSSSGDSVISNLNFRGCFHFCELIAYFRRRGWVRALHHRIVTSNKNANLNILIDFQTCQYSYRLKMNITMFSMLVLANANHGYQPTHDRRSHPNSISQCH